MVKINLQSRPSAPPDNDFLAAAQSAGLNISHIQATGELVRVATDTDKGRKRSGWYVYHDDPVLPYGAFGSWKDNITQGWCARAENTMTAKELADHRARIAAIREQAEKQRRILQEQKAEEAEEFCSNLWPASKHDYLARKKISAHGALLHPQSGELILPAININGDIQTYQRIKGDGTKLFYKGGAKENAFFPIGEWEAASGIILCEGFATGASLHEATGDPVLVCFDSGNMVKVAAKICPSNPAKQFLIAGDNDAFTPNNPGEKAAMEAANHDNAQYILPQFTDTSTKPTDWNDLATLQGIDEVLAQITGDRPLFTAGPVTLDFLSDIPKRQFLYGVHLIRGYVSCTVAPGGVGKTQLAMTDCVSLATGKRMTHNHPHEQCNTWHFNLEDPRDELQRRIAAIINHYKIEKEKVIGKVFINSGRDQRLVLAEKTKDGQILPRKPDIEALTKEIISKKIGLLSIDPFVKSHYVDENSNKDIDEVLSLYAQIAHDTGCAIELVHHISKPPRGISIAGDVDAARGASALAGAVRSARTVVMMTSDEAKQFGIQEERRKWFVREDNAKSNMSPPADKANWYQRHSITLANGDNVGVLDTWQPKDPLDDLSLNRCGQIQDALGSEKDGGLRWSLDKKARNNWACVCIQEMTGKPVNECEFILKAWIENGVIYEAEYEHDGKMKRGLFLNAHKKSGMDDVPF